MNIYEEKNRHFHINYRIVCEKYTVDCNETYG